MYTISISIYTEKHNNVFMLLYYSNTFFGHWPSSGRYITSAQRNVDVVVEVSPFTIKVEIVTIKIMEVYKIIKCTLFIISYKE